MCLTFSNQNKLLKYYGWLVGYKSFCVSIMGDLITLEPFVIKSFEYKFSVINNKLVAEPYNQEQGIYYTLNIHNSFEKIYDLVIEKTGKLGYHIYQFPKELNTETCFNTFCIEDDTVTLPVIFGEENIQMIGSNIVVDRFAIPNQDLYSEICKVYRIEPTEFLIEFLEKLFKSYS
jgi:hypothetical protein